MRSLVFFILIAGLILTSCSSKVSTTGSSSTAGSRYSEDLSGLRPKIESDTIKIPAQKDGNKNNPAQYTEPKFAVNQSLDTVLDSISRINLSNGFVDGFTIQIYSGIKREEALNSKKQISSALPELDTELQYVQPNFRVRTGKYYDRLAAHKDYLAVKRYFPNAIIIPERIPIN